MKTPKRRLVRSIIGLIFVFSLLAAIVLSAQRLLAEAGPANPELNGSVRPVEPCGTWILLETRAEGEAPLEPAARPPDGPIMRDSDHFRVHYGDSQLDGYADNILIAAEKAYLVFLDTLGYNIPPSDGVNGGDSRTDIYIRSHTGFSYLGLTTPESPAPPYSNSYTSYIELTDTMGVDLLLTTTAHEYFHVVQLGYDKDEHVSFLEMTAVWSEDQVYDEINAYLRHLPGFFSRPEKALFSHTYSNVVWAIYLAENFGDDVLKDIFENCATTPDNNVRPATDLVLASFGTTFASEFASFTLWNFFTGARDDGLHYEEGASFPLVSTERTIDCLPLMDYIVTHEAGVLGCNYYELYGDYYTDSLRIDVVPNYLAWTILTSTSFISGSVNTSTYEYPQFTTDPDPLLEPYWHEIDSLVLIFNIDRSALSSNGHGLSAYHLGSELPVPSFVLVLDRDGCRRPFDGINDEFSIRNGEDFPFAAEFAGRSIRFVLSDSIPENLATCDAIFIVGGYEESGVDFQSAELETLMAYMDRGGDVYLESDRLGGWIDPVVGQPTPTEEAFWGYFGCGFQSGDTMAVGNVSSWHTLDVSPLGAVSFSYDWRSPADNFLGRLVPSPADTLTVDQSGHARATVYVGQNESYRIYSTVLLGASTGAGNGSSRSEYLYRILETFDATVPALSVAYMNVTTSGGQVVFDGRIEGYGGEPLSLVRFREEAEAGEAEVALVIHRLGEKVFIEASDSPERGCTYRYRLTAQMGEAEQTLWEGRVALETRPLSLRIVYPNPSHGPFTAVVETPGTELVSLRIFDAAGRQVVEERRILRPGTNEVLFAGRDNFGRALPSGVYFVRLDAVRGSFQKKIVIVK